MRRYNPPKGLAPGPKKVKMGSACGAVGPKMGLSSWRNSLVCGPHRTENQRYFLDYGPRRN